MKKLEGLIEPPGFNRPSAGRSEPVEQGTLVGVEAAIAAQRESRLAVMLGTTSGVSGLHSTELFAAVQGPTSSVR